MTPWDRSPRALRRAGITRPASDFTGPESKNGGKWQPLFELAAYIVGGSPEKRGVVSAANYVARKYGVHSVTL